MSSTSASGAPAGGPLKVALLGSAAVLVAAVLAVAILSAVLGGGAGTCAPPGVPSAPSASAPGTAGTELEGKVSWFGGPNDDMAGPITATGVSVDVPGIAVYNTATKGGWWWVKFPNGRAAILQQTDFGPAPWTGRLVDVTYSALPALGYTEGNFPTDAVVTARYLGKSERWARAPGAITDASAVPVGGVPTNETECGDGLTDSGVPGNVEVAPGANRAGVGMAAETLAFVGRMAGIADRTIVVTTGTNHSQYTTSGSVSDHWDGHAADIGMAGNGGNDGSAVGDRIMAACLIAGGQDPIDAAENASQGGLYTLEHDGLRIQCIWKTYAGGNHYTHVHAGARPVA